jgi:hypothetical protein
MRIMNGLVTMVLLRAEAWQILHFLEGVVVMSTDMIDHKLHATLLML